MSNLTVSVAANPASAATRDADTVAERAKEWVLARKPYEAFWLREIPGDPSITSVLMSRMIKDGNFGVTRLRGEFYMKGEWFPPNPEYGKPEGSWYLHPPCTEQRIYVIARYLGDTYAGLGLAGYDALSVLRWTAQCPLATTVAVAGRGELPPSPIPRQVFFEHRSNQRRAELSMAENTIIEAARVPHWMEESLKEGMENFKSPAYALERMKWYMPKKMIVVRPESLIWGVETEQNQHPRVKNIVHGIAETLKDDVIYTEIAK